ncbi:MAG: hypothetical protein K8U57_12645 [Planctomycetes bacterium]|nr:hypothetical protein [Planctomycetota bacterium]
MWPSPTSTAFCWSPSLVAHASTRVREPVPPRSERKATPQLTAAKRRQVVSETHEDMSGVALWFDSISVVKALPAGLAKLAGFDSAQVVYQPDSLDRSLSRIRSGSAWVRFQFEHNDDLKTCSTLTNSLKVFADRKALYFHVTGSTRDGRNSVKWARIFKDCREVSAATHIHKFAAVPAAEGEPNTIVVSEAELFEISLVALGAFPRTCFEFL